MNLFIFNYKLVDGMGRKTAIYSGSQLVWSRTDKTISLHDVANAKIYFRQINGGGIDDKIFVGDNDPKQIVSHIVLPLAWKYDLNWRLSGTTDLSQETIRYDFYRN